MISFCFYLFRVFFCFDIFFFFCDYFLVVERARRSPGVIFDKDDAQERTGISSLRFLSKSLLR